MRGDYILAVLDVVRAIPEGSVLSYGDIAILLESGGPRQVGAVLSRYGSDVPWWRVIRASGQPPKCHDGRALLHYRQERTALRGRTTGAEANWRVDMAGARWNPNQAELGRLDDIRKTLWAAAMSDPSDEVET